MSRRKFPKPFKIFEIYIISSLVFINVLPASADGPDATGR